MDSTRGGIVLRDRRHTAVRDPKAATLSVGWRARGLPMVPEWDALQAVRWAYLANTVVYRCVRVTADALSRVPFRAGRTPGDSSSSNPASPLARMLGPAPGSPNAVTSARRLWAWTIAQYLVTGRWCWETELAVGSDRPVALWPLPAPYLRAIPTVGTGRYFGAYHFGPVHDPRVLTPDQVVYGWRPSQHDWREPETLLQAARLDISVAVMQDRYDYAFLRNGSRPDFLIVHQPFAEDDEYDAFRQQWNAEHRGVDNAGKPAFVEMAEQGDASGAIDVKQLGISQRDSQSIERYKQKIAAICLAFGTPLSKVGDASGRTFDNAGQEDRNWWEDTVLPLGEELADEINTQLAPRLGDEVGWWDWSTVRALRPDAKMFDFASQAVVRLAEIGADRQTVADAAGLPSTIEWGDMPAPTVPTATAGRDAEPGETRVLEALERLQSTVTALAAAQRTPPAVLPTVSEQRDSEPDEPVETPEQASARRDARWKAVNSRAEQQEKTWTRAYRGLFARQEHAVLTLLTGKRGRQLLARAQRAPGDDPAPQIDPAQVFDASYWTGETQDRSQTLLEPVVLTGGQEVAAAFGVSFDLEAPHVQALVQARANQLAGQVTDTTYRAIQAQLAAGVAAGEDIDTIADRIRSVFADASQNRAVTIARTEVISAYNAGAHLTAATLDPAVVGGKEWIATRDLRVREAHADADGQVVPVAGMFTVGGESVMYPGDGSASNAVNCRCTVSFLTPAMMPRARLVDRRTALTILATADDPDPLTLRARLKAVA